MVTLTIDGITTSVPEGTLLINAAKTLGIDIPYACYHRHLQPYGGCRVCLVEIERMPKLQTSCTTVVSEGMVVHTDTPAVIKARQGQIEFLLANHPLECPVCDKGGECELQALSYYHGRGSTRFRGEKRHNDDYDFGPLVWRNTDRCIRCKRCIRFMDEVAGEQVINYDNRGPNTVVDTFDHGKFDSKYSGNTVTICPVGALLNEPYIYKARGWELEYFNTVCPHCANGCNMQLGIRQNTILRHIVWENPDVNGAWLCDRGQFGFQFVNSPNRLDVPLVKREGVFTSSTWNDALHEIAELLNDIKLAHGPDAIGAIGSAKCTNEDNYVLQKFMRAVIGTNNIDHRLYRKGNKVGGGLNSIFDYDAGTVSLNGIRNANSILLFGCDISEEQPVTALRIREAVVRKNAALVIANDKHIQYDRYANAWLRYLPGSEVALINGMINIILSEGLEDSDYISSRTEGIEDLRRAVQEYTPANTEILTGVPQSILLQAARSFAQADGAVILYGTDILAHRYSGDVIRALGNMAMVTGNIGKMNGGIAPVYLDANAQGAIDMGILPDNLPGHLPIDDPVNRNAFSEAWSAEIPVKQGMDTADMLNAAVEGRLKALYIMGADVISEFPDRNLAMKALESVEFLVVHDLFMTETAALAHVLLPGKSYAEKDGTFTNIERRVQRLNQGISYAGPLQAEWHALVNIAGMMDYEFQYNHPSDIMDEMARLMHVYGGITYEWLGGNGTQWPCPVYNDPGSPVLYGGEYEYSRWKIEPVSYNPSAQTDTEYPMRLLTREVLFNGESEVVNSPSIAQLVSEPSIDINPDDARNLGISDGEKVAVSSPFGRVALKVLISGDCSGGCVIMPRNIPGAPANLLMNFNIDTDYVKIERLG